MSPLKILFMNLIQFFQHFQQCPFPRAFIQTVDQILGVCKEYPVPCTNRIHTIAPDTIDTYIGYFMEAFLIQKAERYNVKGRKYIKTPVKYYYSDPGLRNARLGFRQLEETHLMENVLYNDLIRRGFDVDVGVIEQNVRDESGKNVRKQLEIDFVVNRGDERCYIQSALSINDPEKKEQEIASLIRIPDSFKKIVVVKDYVKPWWDDNGIQYVGIEDFLLDESLISG